MLDEETEIWLQTQLVCLTYRRGNLGQSDGMQLNAYNLSMGSRCREGCVSSVDGVWALVGDGSVSSAPGEKTCVRAEGCGSTREPFPSL